VSSGQQPWELPPALAGGFAPEEREPGEEFRVQETLRALSKQVTRRAHTLPPRHPIAPGRPCARGSAAAPG
jgi:hypothetical protein